MLATFQKQRNEGGKGGKNGEEKTDISEEEIKKLKEVLNSTYSVEIEKIHINNKRTILYGCKNKVIIYWI